MKMFLLSAAYVVAMFGAANGFGQVTPQQFATDAQAFATAYETAQAAQVAEAQAQANLVTSQSAAIASYQVVVADLATLNPTPGTANKVGDPPHGYPGPHYWPQPYPYYPTPIYPQPTVNPTPAPLPTPPAGYQYQLGADGAFHLVPIIAAHAEKVGAAPVIPWNLLPNLIPGLNQQPNTYVAIPGTQTAANPQGQMAFVHAPGYWAGTPPNVQWVITR